MSDAKNSHMQASDMIKRWARSNYLWVILLLCFTGFAFGELYRNIYALIGISGLYLLIKHRKSLSVDPRMRYFALLFMCLWLPMLTALVDAEYLQRSLGTTLRFLVYFLAAAAIIRLTLTQQIAHKLLFGTYAVMLFMSLDGILQWLTGSNILGYPLYNGHRVVGLFYPEPSFTLFLAIFSPLFFEAVRKIQHQYRWAWLTLIPFVTAIILGGSRTAWMLFIIAILYYGVFYLHTQKEIRWKQLLSKGAAVLLLVGIAMAQSSWIQERAAVVSQLFSGDYNAANIATANRLPLWETAVTMAKDNWLNGVGPRAYSASYEKYAPAGDFWLDHKVRQPHMLILEIATDTGLIGIIGYFLFLGVLFRRLWRLSGSHHTDAVPWGICAAVAAFPLSAAMPLYGFFYAQLVWLPLTIFVALQWPKPPRNDSKVSLNNS